MFAFLDYFANVFAPGNFLILCLGTAGGLIMGALPGLSPTMAVALLIPFTYHMDPIGGLILLGAVYTSTVAGGAVSAILLKIPGAPANIATMLDGHEMARGGRAGEALQLSFLSSGVGGVLGIFVLIFFTPVLAQWALDFGPSHLFWMAVLGVTVIASLASSSLLKGLTSGCIGLWISSIGFDSIQGEERFVFTPHLQGGVHIIPALVGLFAVPQVLEMLARARAKKAQLLRAESHSVLRSAKLLRTKPAAMGIGGIVGVIIGLVPGAGGQIAGLVAYDQTRKFSDNPDNFGKGEPEGVIAAETANNAMVGPSLVPLLTLSVPGSPTAAVLLGGLLIHGIFPSADIFTDYPEVSWTFINSLLVGQILMVVFGLWLSRLAARVMLLPENMLAAGVMALAVFGAYSVQHSYSDVLVMAALGFGMYGLQCYGFSAGPLVLGIVLGPIAEQNFLQGRIIANAGDGMLPYFFTGGLNIALMAVIALSVASGLLLEIRQRRRTAAKTTAAEKTKTAATNMEETITPPHLRWGGLGGGNPKIRIPAFAGITRKKNESPVLPHNRKRRRHRRNIVCDCLRARIFFRRRGCLCFSAAGFGADAGFVRCAAGAKDGYGGGAGARHGRMAAAFAGGADDFVHDSFRARGRLLCFGVFDVFRRRVVLRARAQRQKSRRPERRRRPMLHRRPLRPLLPPPKSANPLRDSLLGANCHSRTLPKKRESSEL